MFTGFCGARVPLDICTQNFKRRIPMLRTKLLVLANEKDTQQWLNGEENSEIEGTPKERDVVKRR
jgi:hypothetical protein